ncbi:reverse transcriptase [Tanacetum coccineum]
MYFSTDFRSTFSKGDCFIPFDIKKSFSRLVNLLEVKQHVSASVKEIDYVQLGIVNQAKLKLQPRAFFSIYARFDRMKDSIDALTRMMAEMCYGDKTREDCDLVLLMISYVWDDKLKYETPARVYQMLLDDLLRGKHLSQREYQEKRAQNLCFFCDKKYVPGHKCAGQLFSLVLVPDDEDCVEDCLEEERKHTIHILVDCGSTHNFVDVAVAKKLGCPIRSICPLAITVGDGYNVATTSECKQFKWQLQGVTFCSDVMLLPLVCCDMILGIQWLSTLGDIKCNFKELRMEFM